MTIQYGSAWSQGSREDQQDYFAFADQINSALPDHAGILAVLADGMGGMIKGKEAAIVAVDTMRRSYAGKMDNNSVAVMLYTAVEQANQAVLDLARQHGCESQIGTTIAAAVVDGRRLHWISVGDSRVYLCRKGILRQLSPDHNYGQVLRRKLEQGLITQQEFDSSLKKEALTSFLGLPVLPELGRGEEENLENGDYIILCSDGLYKTLCEDEISTVLVDHLDAQTTAEVLVDKTLAKQNPYQDNVTVAIMVYSGANVAETGVTQLRCNNSGAFGWLKQKIFAKRPFRYFVLMMLLSGLSYLGAWEYFR